MATDQQPPRRHIIGYALAPKKQSSFIQPSLVSQARSRGIDFIPITPTLPLTSQGPFDAIIHKLYGPAWDSALLAFSAAHPSVPIIDPPAAIARVHDRSTMLQAVSDLHHSVAVPRQIIVLDSTALTHLPAALRFPVIAKSLTANGSDGSHKMSLVFRPDDLAHLTPPLVLQEFVNHGGVIFKVYVAGEFVRCVKRKSLPDVSKDGMGAEELTFSHISNVAIDTVGSEEGYIENTEMPPLEFVTEIAHGLRRSLGLRLFNFDLIRDAKGGDQYLVIDINYFPGFCKLPSYENMLTDFFCDIVNQKQHSGDLGFCKLPSYDNALTDFFCDIVNQKQHSGDLGFCKLPSYENALTDFFGDIVNQKQHSGDLVEERVCKEAENVG